MAKLTLKHFIETSRIAQAEVWSKRSERILPSWTIIPVKETCCNLRHRWYMFPEKQGLVSTIPDLKCWIFAFYGSKTNFYVQFYFLKQAILASWIIWLNLWLLELGPFKTFFTSSPNFPPRLLFAKVNLVHWSDCTCRTTFRPLKKRGI